jgi:hypothetical protein
VLLCRGLTAEEELVCKLKYGAAGTIETYRRHRRPCDIRQGDGEEVIAVKTEHEGYVEVEGKRSKYPVLEVVAKQSGLTVDQVRRRLGNATRKIKEASEAREP